MKCPELNHMLLSTLVGNMAVRVTKMPGDQKEVEGFGNV